MLPWNNSLTAVYWPIVMNVYFQLCWTCGRKSVYPFIQFPLTMTVAQNKYTWINPTHRHIHFVGISDDYWNFVSVKYLRFSLRTKKKLILDVLTRSHVIMNLKIRNIKPMERHRPHHRSNVQCAWSARAVNRRGANFKQECWLKRSN